MAKSDALTEIAVVLDRSGSMLSIQADMEGGLWSTILQQHQQPGRCRVSLFQFDNEWEVAFEGRPSGDITSQDCQLVPRGATALNDAVVKSLAALENRIRNEAQADRPEHVIVLVITDGCENASTECSVEDAKAAIQRVTDKFGWQFAFLAADADGFKDGRNMVGGSKSATAGSFSRSKSMFMFERASDAISRARTGAELRIEPEE